MQRGQGDRGFGCVGDHVHAYGWFLALDVPRQQMSTVQASLLGCHGDGERRDVWAVPVGCLPSSHAGGAGDLGARRQEASSLPGAKSIATGDR